MSPPDLELLAAGLRFGAVRALDGVDLRIDRGERVALIGPSGAGKSSLLSLLNATAGATEGRVRVFGEDVAQLRPRELQRLRRSVGTIHQGLHLAGPLRVVHNVNAGRLGAWPLWRSLVSLLSPREAGAAAAALARVGLADKLHARTERLSGGEQQRVAIARVLRQDPRVILADEPIASLDRERGREVVDLLLALAAEHGTTLLVSLHDVDTALKRFDRVIGLRAGRVAFDAAPGAVPQEALERLYRIDEPVAA